FHSDVEVQRIHSSSIWVLLLVCFGLFLSVGLEKWRCVSRRRLHQSESGQVQAVGCSRRFGFSVRGDGDYFVASGSEFLGDVLGDAAEELKVFFSKVEFDDKGS